MEEEQMQDTIYPLAPVDDVLENVGLPKTKVLLDAVSPRTVLGNKLGLTLPGDVLENVVEEVTSGLRPGKLPELPGIGRL
jgi:hypothetical protein